MPTVNVKETFGAHSFLVERRSRCVVELGSDGTPNTPLSSEGDGYILLSSLSHSLIEGRPRKRGKIGIQDARGDAGDGRNDDALMNDRGQGLGEGSDDTMVAALEAKVAELRAWVEALRNENKVLQSRLRTCESGLDSLKKERAASAGRVTATG